MKKNFVHLCMQTEYSAPYSIIRVSDLVSHIKKIGMDSCAITDFGSIKGVPQFYRECNKNGIKPIIGMALHIKRCIPNLYLIAENNKGLKNLITLSSLFELYEDSCMFGLEREVVFKYSDGLIAYMNPSVLKHTKEKSLEFDYEKTLNECLEYDKAFGRNNFFIQINGGESGNSEEEQSNLIKISHETEIPLLAANPKCFLNKEDFDTYSLFRNSSYVKKNYFRNSSDYKFQMPNNCNSYVKSEEEIIDEFKTLPQALENTVKIAERCNITIEHIENNTKTYPTSINTKTDNSLGRLTAAAKKVMNNISSEMTEKERSVYSERLKKEIDYIARYDGYGDNLLFARDIVSAFKPHIKGTFGFAGSLIGYLLGITSIDPIKYNIPFIDFIKWSKVFAGIFDVTQLESINIAKQLIKNNGFKHIAGVPEFNKLSAVSAVNIVCEGLNINNDENILNALSGEGESLNSNSDNDNSVFETIANIHPKGEEIIKHAKKLNGIYLSASLSENKIIISDNPAWEYVPVDYQGDIITIKSQYDIESCEELGLSLINKTSGLKIIKFKQNNFFELCNKTLEYAGFPYHSIYEIPLNDEKIFNILSGEQECNCHIMNTKHIKFIIGKERVSSIEDIITAYENYSKKNKDMQARISIVTYCLQVYAELFLKTNYGEAYDKAYLEIKEMCEKEEYLSSHCNFSLVKVS